MSRQQVDKLELSSLYSMSDTGPDIHQTTCELVGCCSRWLEISSIVILPDTHFLNHGKRLDFVMSFLRAENSDLQFLHFNLWMPFRTPHLMTSKDPHSGQRWRLLIFRLSLISIYCRILTSYKGFTNHFWQLYPGISIRKKAAAFLQLLDSEVGAEGVEPPTLCL